MGDEENSPRRDRGMKGEMVGLGDRTLQAALFGTTG